MTAGKYVIGRLKLQGQHIPANGRFGEDDGRFDYSASKNSGFGMVGSGSISTQER
jgi:hypothetical protein